MNGHVNVKAPAPLLSFSYRYVVMFTIAVQAVSLLAAYILGVSYHYNKLIRTHCIVSCKSLSSPIAYEIL